MKNAGTAFLFLALAVGTIVGAVIITGSGERGVPPDSDTDRQTEIVKIVHRTSAYYTGNTAHRSSYTLHLHNGSTISYEKWTTGTPCGARTAECETDTDPGFNVARNATETHQFTRQDGEYTGVYEYVPTNTLCVDLKAPSPTFYPC